MSRFFGMLILVLLAPIAGLAQSKSSKPMSGSPQEYAIIRMQREVVGRLSNVDTAASGNKTFSLNIAYQYLVPKRSSASVPSSTGRGPSLRKTNYQTQLATLQWQYQQAMATKSPTTRQRKLAQLTMRMQQLQAAMAYQQMQIDQLMLAQSVRFFGSLARTAPSIAVGFKQFDMETVEKVIVRRQFPPCEYDTKGTPKKYSRAELDRMRGKDKRLPGYEASFVDLQEGQYVKVYPLQAVAEKKAKKNDKNAAAAEGPEADKQDKGKKATLTATVDLPRVRMILILTDPTDGEGQDQVGRKRTR